VDSLKKVAVSKIGNVGRLRLPFGGMTNKGGRDIDVIDLELYRFIMRQPVGLRHSEYRKGVGWYVSQMSEADKQLLRDRRYEILENWAEWTCDNYEILLRLGFDTREAEMLRDKRLTSPGVRNVIRNRVEGLTKRTKKGVI